MTLHQDMIYALGGVPVLGEMTTGKVWFVHSVRTNKTGNNGKKPSQAFATLDEATNACTANNNDIVYIMPNHAETIASATTWAPDVAGVQYIGIGLGSDAPELTFSATSSQIIASGENSLFRNIRFIAGISAVAKGVAVTAAHVTFERCTWDFGANTYDFVEMLACHDVDYLTVSKCRFIAENATAGAAMAVHLDGSDHARIEDNLFTGDYSITVVGTHSTDAVGKSVMILGNNIYNDDTASTYGAGISFRVAFTGVIARNMVGCLSSGIAADPATIDPGSCMMFENYVQWQIDHYGVATLMGIATT